ncbi:MAG: hypothetical protein ACI9X0_001840 [Kiritimatiellia bacterium]|jgi:hypothetical protein
MSPIDEIVVLVQNMRSHLSATRTPHTHITTHYMNKQKNSCLRFDIPHTAIRVCSLIVLLASVSFASAQTTSVARVWNEAALEAIKIDVPHPPVHARNLFHLSAAMWDAWAAYDSTAVGYACNLSAVASNTAAARDAAVSFAAYRVLTARYALSTNAVQTIIQLNDIMTGLGYDPADTNRIGDDPATIGNRAAYAILNFAIDDGSNETNQYADQSYTAANEPLILAFPGTTMQAPNRWQPLAFEYAQTQNGLKAEAVQSFLGSQWRDVRPFAMTRDSNTNIYLDPGPPPYAGAEGDAAFKSNNVEILRYSSTLDPDSGIMIDISPAGPGKNNTLGTHNGIGHATNPATGSPYTNSLVRLSDFGRVVAEIWADGPDSETPPGHWNVLANTITEYPDFERRFEGSGPILDALEWDIKVYFAINGALHDAATAAWTCKRFYDYVRPISSIRWLASLGQASDPGQPSYDPDGIYLASNLVEVITLASTAPGGRHAHLTNETSRALLIGRIAVNTWPGEPETGTNTYSGKTWIQASTWQPYQRDTFVTPAFPGYVSGHSAFSRAAAEVLTLITGDPYFPGGYGSYTAPAGSLLFEQGPSTDITLQWATYYDAADEAGISRLYGGIHVAPDDVAGRIMGAQVGLDAYALARKYFDGTILNETTYCQIKMDANMTTITWDQIRGMQYRCVETPTLHTPFATNNAYTQAKSHIGEAHLPASAAAHFYRITRKHDDPQQ